MFKIILLPLFVFSSLGFFANEKTNKNDISQADIKELNLAIFGDLKDFDSRNLLEGAEAAIYIGTKLIEKEVTDSLGKFEFFMALGQNYKLEFSMNGYVSKSLEIDTRTIPEKDKKAGFAIGPLSITLFQEVIGSDYSIFDYPIAKFVYEKKKGSMVFDSEHGDKMNMKIEDFMLDYENRTLINGLIDNWHLAAAEADEEIYFNSMTEDAIFLGTDKTERWEKKVFEEWAQPHFEKDKAWAFTARDRVIYFHDDNKLAWFEELLDTWMGTCRGSGVVELTEDGWKIKHYNLALLVDNDKMDKVIEVTK